MKFVDICTALYDYNSQHEEEITFKADDTLYILENDDSDWYKAQLKPKSAGEDDVIGLVPANYVQRVSIFFFSREKMDVLLGEYMLLIIGFV
jgi:hypothetical protein